VPEEAYRLNRKAVLQRFFDQTPLYHHLPVRQRFETAAKRNLGEALAQL
jgi:predicted metal-dependent HD superfamily phosphohydrolase